jgi:hypothetical protein
MGSCQRTGQGCSRSCRGCRRYGCRHGRWSFHRRINPNYKGQTRRCYRPYTPIQSTTYRYGYKGTGSHCCQTSKTRSARTKQVGKGFRVRSTCTHHETEMDVGWKEKGWKDGPKIVGLWGFISSFWCILGSFTTCMACMYTLRFAIDQGALCVYH